MRLFIAIPAPSEIQKQLKHAQDQLKHANRCADIRWSPTKQFHLTLNFLGEVSPDHLAELEKSVSEVCARHPVIALNTHAIGFFPNAKTPKLIWAGIDDADGYLVTLQSALAKAVQPFTHETKAEKFIGHLTLGRVNRIDHATLEALEKSAASLNLQSFGHWLATEVNLYRSDLTPTGANHTLLTSHPLAK